MVSRRGILQQYYATSNDQQHAFHNWPKAQLSQIHGNQSSYHCLFADNKQIFPADLILHVTNLLFPTDFSGKCKKLLIYSWVRHKSTTRTIFSNNPWNIIMLFAYRILTHLHYRWCVISGVHFTLLQITQLDKTYPSCFQTSWYRKKSRRNTVCTQKGSIFCSSKRC